jgi:hypothetical protein
MKFVPLAVRVKAAPPARAVLGDMLVSVGSGLFTVRESAAEVPPPGAEFATVTERVPGEATSLAGMAALSWVLLTKVVVRLEPLTWTTDPLTKFVPFTVRLKAELPAVTVLGEMLLSDGTGLLTVKITDPLVSPDEGFVTVIANDPALARSPPVSVAVN